MAGIELNCRWHFAQSNGGQEQGPKEATGETFKKDPYDSLVRESIQNSLDVASSEDKPVIVSFMFNRTQGDYFPKFFSIRNHIEACLLTYNDENSHKKFDPMLDYLDGASMNTFDYLEVKDENTTGMSYKKGDRKSGFYSFVKSIGNSSKTSSSAGGSYGFGKAAFYLLSKTNSVLVSTLTEKGKHYFEGVCSLCSHEIRGVNYEPVGFYCDNDEEEPVSNSNNIPECFKRNTVGSSVFIMGLGLDDKARKEAMLAICTAAIKHFWMAILKNKLIVRIGVENKYNEINSENLITFAEKSYPDFDDARRGHKNPRPYIDAVVNVNADNNHLYFEKDIPHLGKVCLYLLKSKNGNDYTLNMRSPMMLVNHDRNGSQYGFYSVFICTDGEGNKILRMAENAQHNEWDVRNAHEQDKQQVKDALLAKQEFIQECIGSVFVSGEAESLTFGGLDDFLTIPSGVDDSDEFTSEDGRPNGDTTDEETSSQTTELDDPRIQKRRVPTEGVVKIKKKKKKPQVIDDEGELQPTGHEPEIEPEDDPFASEPDDEEPKPDTPDDTSDDNPTPLETDEPEDKEPEEDEEDDNNSDEQPMEEDEDFGEKAPRLKPLRISYRTFAQSGEEGIEHRLIIHSNRASDRVAITIISGGESSDEALAIRKSNNGNIVGNRLTNVSVNEGKTVITVWFADDMRHAIKLNVDEDQ